MSRDSYRDQGLTYQQAAHGVQSAVSFDMSQSGVDPNAHQASRMLKHLRVGVDMRAADAGALALLLIEKGVFTREEYEEALRLGANEELARYTEYCRNNYMVEITFR